MSSHTPSQWQRMHSLRDDSSQRNRFNSGDQTIDIADRDEAMDPRMAAFRERYAISAKYIDRLFPTSRPCCRSDDLDLDEPEFDHANGIYPNGQHHQPSKPSVPVPPTRKIDEDDYDFDDDDDDEEEEEDGEDTQPPAKKVKSDPPSATASGPGVPMLMKTMSSQALEVPGKSNHAVAAAAAVVVVVDPKKAAMATREKLEADRKAAELAAKSALSTMYFTLENDRDAMLEQQKLEESDRQVNAEGSGPGEQGGVTGKLSSVNLGASSLTLKHLITRIDEKREKVKVSDMELRNLISEVRKNRSKWASEDKIGQEELYEAAEKVTNELRAYTEHSTAFLNRVNKREAPDYFNIIKQPMDLGSVLKKLKSLAYKSKAEFVADLNLIWQNCLTYNADSNHYLRKHAKAMQKRMQEMIPLIPEITIRDRAEVEAEEAGVAEADAEAESDDEPIMSTRGRKGPGTKKAKKARGPQTRAEATPEVKPPILNLLRADSMPPGEGPSQNGGSQNGFLTPPVGNTPFNAGTIPGMDMDQSDKLDDNDADAEYLAWKTMTKKARAKISSERHKLFRGDRIAPDEPALLRTREGMGQFMKKELKHFYQKEDGDSPGNSLLSNDKEKLVVADEGEEELLIPDYYDPLSAVPELPWKIEWRGDSEEGADLLNEMAQMGRKEIWSAPKTGLVNKMDANMKQMQETRKICSKIGVIKQMQSHVQVYANQFTKYNPAEFAEAPVDDYVVSDDGPIFSQTVCRAALQRSVGKIFYHAGFEEFQPTAMDAVTDIAADYFQKLAKTVMLYREAPQRFTHQEVILHAMHENGVDLDALDSYIRDDIERLGSKLGVVHTRMKSHLADLLRPALAENHGDGSTMFNDGSEQFIGGDFAEDIGDDFFGFRELGLDKEFGLSSLSVPLHLLQKTFRNHPDSTIHAATLTDGFKPPPLFEPLTHDLLKKQIGLIQNFFLAKLHANKEEALIEDEDLPIKQRAPKPRLPPTGKISMPRKRPIQSQGGGSKKKKKPNPPQTAPPPPATKPVPVSMARSASKNKMSDDEEGGNGGMISPESLVAA